jgi:hypothetical protein
MSINDKKDSRLSIGTVSPSEKLLLELLLRLDYRLNGTFCTLATQTPIFIIPQFSLSFPKESNLP